MPASKSVLCLCAKAIVGIIFCVAITIHNFSAGIFVRFIDGTPRVVANTVMFSLELGPEVEQATCSVVLTSSGARTDVDCECSIPNDISKN